MARQLISEEYLEANVAVVTGAPLTMFAWFKPNNLDVYHEVLSLSNFPAASDLIWFDISPTTGYMRCFYFGGDTDTTTNGCTAGVWNSCFLSVDAGLNARGIVNGDLANQATFIGSPVTGLNRTSIGRLADGSPFASIDGSVAWATFWNVQLTTDEAVALDSGVHPLRIRPDKIVEHWTLNSTGAEVGRIAGTSLAMTGTVDKVESNLLALGDSTFIPSVVVAPPAVANPIVMII